MNRLSLEDRVRVLAALVEGNSIRGTSRLTGAAKGTILKLLADVGDACALYHDENVRNLSCVRVQLDEIWSFCHAKERNLPRKLRGDDRAGDMWTWTAIDADTKMIVAWHLGKRTLHDATYFVRDLSRRITSYVQISTDGFNRYKEPIRRYFMHRADHGTEVKVFGFDDESEPDRKYSPLVVKEVQRTAVFGAPDPAHISTAYVERQNLNMRMSMRRFTRLTNAFSKKAQNLQRSLAIYAMHYNFVRNHQTLGTTPALKHGITDRRWTLADLANLPDLMRGGLAA
ncbi:MAG TPA: IS1 family transposase [Candidatus Acidoferrales bacterium]|nr:IS1 family transposase [Candidatus Acidoferrales bacterium]